MRLQTSDRWLDVGEDGIDPVVRSEDAGVLKRVGDFGRGRGEGSTDVDDGAPLSVEPSAVPNVTNDWAWSR